MCYKVKYLKLWVRELLAKLLVSLENRFKAIETRQDNFEMNFQEFVDVSNAKWSEVDTATTELGNSLTGIATRIEALAAQIGQQPTPEQVQNLVAKMTEEAEQLRSAGETAKGLAATPLPDPVDPTPVSPNPITPPEFTG